MGSELNGIAKLQGAYNSLEQILGYKTTGRYYTGLGQVCEGKLSDLKNFKKLDYIRIYDAENTNFFEGLDATCSNLSSITKLELYYQGITSISGIEVLTGLRELYLASSYIYDLKPLMNLSALRILDLTNNSVEDIYPLNNLIGIDNGTTNLTTLKLDTNLLEKYSVNYDKDTYITAVGKRSNEETIIALKNAGVSVTYTGNKF